MSSLRRVLSSRANGARSRGPATSEGKRRSAYNALRHGLLAKCVVMTGESGENFELMLRQHVDRFAPLDGVEFGMIEEMASSYWRLRRAWAVETRLLDDALSAQASGDQLGRIAAAFGDLASQPRLALLLRYQSTLHRAYQRALRNLLMLRKVCETNPVPESDTMPPAPTAADSPRGAGPLASVGQTPWSAADAPVGLPGNTSDQPPANPVQEVPAPEFAESGPPASVGQSPRSGPLGTVDAPGSLPGDASNQAPPDPVPQEVPTAEALAPNSWPPVPGPPHPAPIPERPNLPSRRDPPRLPKRPWRPDPPPPPAVPRSTAYQAQPQPLALEP